MKKSVRYLTHCAMIAALYVVLTHLQNMIFPASTSAAIQFRASEALCVLALFTPAAIPGLVIGTLLFNLTSGAALPLDFLLGSLATALAATGMWYTRKLTIRTFPLLALLMPAVFNALIVGWELSYYVGGAFYYNAAAVAIGELGVLFTLGCLLFYALRARGLHRKLFG